MWMNRLRLPTSERTLCIAYVTAVVCVSVLLAAAFAYAYCEDPWMTPRLSTSMSLWWSVRGTLTPLIGLLVIIGICGTVGTENQRYRWFYIAGILNSIATFACANLA